MDFCCCGTQFIVPHSVSCSNPLFFFVFSSFQISWTHALRQIVLNCYKFHGREDLLPTFTEDDDGKTSPSVGVLKFHHNNIKAICSPPQPTAQQQVTLPLSAPCRPRVPCRAVFVIVLSRCLFTRTPSLVDTSLICIIALLMKLFLSDLEYWTLVQGCHPREKPEKHREFWQNLIKYREG